MAKETRKPPRHGSPRPEDIYLAVGVALSWWEASEDVLMGLFNALCAERQPVAQETYVASPRGRRNEMLKSALERHTGSFLPGELERLGKAMRALDRLSSVRNEIAHGHCGTYNSTVDGVVVMEGNYLLSSHNEHGWHVRSPRYAHTATTISEFTAAVRAERAVIMDVQNAFVLRRQEEQSKRSPQAGPVEAMAKAVADGRLPPDRFIADPFLRQMIAAYDAEHPAKAEVVPPEN